MNAWGIDLGTTRSAVAHVNRFGRAELIDNALGERLTPSVVWASAKGIVVGKHAKEMAGGYPDQVARLFKRHMNEPDWRFTSPASGSLSAVQLSAEVLRSLASDVQRATGQPMEEAVIAVPAYFGHVARTATYEAGAWAGLNVIDLINEPTAAVLAWMLESGQRPDNGLLVYDLGGGTFDSVAVTAEGEELKVVTIGGDNVLGGHDWDRALTLHFNDVFSRHFSLSEAPTANLQTDHAWLEKAEYAKVFLASNLADEVQVVLQHGQHVLPFTVTRKLFDDLTNTLRVRTLVASGWVLQHAKVTGLAPDRVLLAGGMSRLPILKDLLKQKFGLTPAPMSRPDYMVAEGAALWAMKRSAERHVAKDNPGDVARRLIRDNGLPEEFAKVLASLRVSHVASRGFAIRYRERDTRRPRLVFLAHAQKALPQPTTWSGCTPEDDVTSMEVPIYEQNGRETADPRDHVHIGAVRMENIPRGWPKDTPVEVSMTLDTDQVIRVSFTHPGIPVPAAADIYVGAPLHVGEVSP